MCCFPCFCLFSFECMWRSESSLSFLSLNLNQAFLSMHSDDLTPRTFPSGSMSNTLSQLFSLYFCDWYSLLCYTLLYFAFCATLFLYVLIPLWVLFSFHKNLMALLCNFSGRQPWFPADVRSVFCQLVRQPQRVLCLQRST